VSLKKKQQTKYLANPALAELLRDTKFRRAYERLLPEYARINARMTQKSQHQLLARHLGLTQRAIRWRWRRTHCPNFQKGGVIHLSKRTFAGQRSWHKSMESRKRNISTWSCKVK
jgi:hypothetical protein